MSATEEERAGSTPERGETARANGAAPAHGLGLSDSLAAELVEDALDPDATLERLALAAVPGIADWCVVHVREDDGRIRLLTAAHAEPAMRRLALESARTYTPDPAGDHPIAEVIRSGEPRLASEISAEQLAAAARDAGHLELLRGLGISSAMIVPLRARGRTLGAISFVSAGSGRRYESDDLAAVREMVNHASLLADNARLYSGMREAEGALRRSLEQLQIILGSVADGITVQQPDGKLLFANDAAAHTLGYRDGAALAAAPIEEIVSGFEIFQEDGAPLPLAGLPGRRALEERRTVEQVLRYRIRATGEERWAVTKANPVLGENGEVRFAINIFTDITPLKRIEEQRVATLAAEARVAAETKFRGIVESAPDALMCVDPAGQITVANERAEELFGYAREELLGHSIDMLVPARLRGLHGQHRDRFGAEPRARQMGEGFGDLSAVRKDGSEFPAEISLSPIETEDGPLVACAIRDISERKRAEERITHLAFHDGLTGLPNRTMLEEHLRLALARARRQGRAVGLLYIDLDEFKMVNDSLGHLAGDDLLRQAARRLSGLTRDGDLLARQGGDEFLLLVSDIDSGAPGTVSAAISAIAERIHAELREPFVVEGQECRLGASVGVSLYPHDAHDADGLLRHADAALYSGKAVGRGATVIYADAEADPLERLSFTTRLRRAAERGEFVLHYQPIVDLRDGTVTGVEALVRWDDPERGLIAPADFIAAAEGLGLIDRIGDWVFDAACRQARVWRDGGADLAVSINLSVRQLWQGDLLERLVRRVEASGLDTRNFMLELTETAAMTGFARGAHAMRALAGAGFHLAIDDFGMGYSSFGRLRELPVDTLKVDRSFVADAEGGPGIARAVVELAHNLELRPVAEGIETEQQWRALSDWGCRLGQGFLFSPPVPAEDVPVARIVLPVA